MPLPRVLPLVAAALAISACASRDDRPHGTCTTGSTVVLASSGWLNGSLEPRNPDESCVGCRAVVGNAALRPDDPWLGTIGLRLLPGDCEVGMGLCVPNVLSSSAQTQPVSRARDVGVGAWLSFDF